MQHTIGYSHRNRITDYQDIILFIHLLKKISVGTAINSIGEIINRDKLLIESNRILNEMKWNTETARSFLKENFEANSRSDLSMKDMLRFNMLTEAIMTTKDSSNMLK